VAAAIATGILFVSRFAMFFGGGDDDDNVNPIVLILLMILAPLAAFLLQMALTRSREFEADRSGARLIGDGEPLARALLKLEQGAKQIPMNVDPAHAQAYIINPLTGRNMQFKSLFMSHPPTEARVARLRARDWQN
jgi:heat shock protein HtpX